MTLQTEYEFTLPKGYVVDGEVHREGIMRLATAADEILPMKDPRVRANEDYLPIIIFSRVVTRLIINWFNRSTPFRSCESARENSCWIVASSRVLASARNRFFSAAIRPCIPRSGRRNNATAMSDAAITTVMRAGFTKVAGSVSTEK